MKFKPKITKEQKEKANVYKNQRNTWKLNPITRIKKSKKKDSKPEFDEE